MVKAKLQAGLDINVDEANGFQNVPLCRDVYTYIVTNGGECESNGKEQYS